jgi:hypothetical protein
MLSIIYTPAGAAIVPKNKPMYDEMLRGLVETRSAPWTVNMTNTAAIQRAKPMIGAIMKAVLSVPNRCPPPAPTDRPIMSSARIGSESIPARTGVSPWLPLYGSTVISPEGVDKIASCGGEETEYAIDPVAV